MREQAQSNRLLKDAQDQVQFLEHARDAERSGDRRALGSRGLGGDTFDGWLAGQMEATTALWRQAAQGGSQGVTFIGMEEVTSTVGILSTLGSTESGILGAVLARQLGSVAGVTTFVDPLGTSYQILAGADGDGALWNPARNVVATGWMPEAVGKIAGEKPADDGQAACET